MAESNSIRKHSAPDDETWNAWMKKNTDRDRAQFRKLARMAGIALLIGLACLLIWAWTQHGDKRNDVLISTALSMKRLLKPQKWPGRSGLSASSRFFLSRSSPE